MKPLKSLISKSKINKYSTKKSLDEEGPFLVLPYNKFYTGNKFYSACLKIKNPDIEILNSIELWVLTFEVLDEMFLYLCPNEFDIKCFDITIWPMNRFNSDSVKDIKKYASKYNSNNPEFMGNVKSLTWKEIKKIWDL